MRIVIDLTSLSYHMTGIERYVLCISEEMIKQDKKNEYLLLFRKNVYEPLKTKIDGKRIRACTLKGNNKLLFYQAVMPLHLYRIKADRYLFFAFTSPVFFKRKGIYNTIHDMGAWDCVSTMKALQAFYFRTVTRISARNSQGLITVSKFSQKRICEILHIEENKIKVAYSAFTDRLASKTDKTIEMVREKYMIPERYIMSLSTVEPRKNLSLLLEAFVNIKDQVDYDLVLVGRMGWKMEETLAKYSLQSRVHWTGFVEDEEVTLLYKNTLCFVFPSLYEGFGLPPVEALVLGAPVLASNAASVPEILMKQALYFKNNDLNSLESALVKLPDRIDKMPKALNVYQRLEYSFQSSARKILEFIEA